MHTAKQQENFFCEKRSDIKKGKKKKLLVVKIMTDQLIDSQ